MLTAQKCRRRSSQRLFEMWACGATSELARARHTIIAPLIAILATCLLCASPSTAAEGATSSANASLQETSATKASADQAPQVSPYQKDENTSEKDKNTSTLYSYEAVLLVILILALLGAMFFLLMYWSQRSERVSYLGNLYQETIEDIEYKRLIAAPSEKYQSFQYHNDIKMEWIDDHPFPPRPPELPYERSDGDGIRRTRNPFGYEEGRPPEWGRTLPPGLGGLGSSINDNKQNIDPTLEKKLNEIFNKWKNDVDEWNNKVEVEAQRRYQKDLDAARNKAKEKASLAVDVDLSALRGRGAEFVLEFTTVVVIIFAAIILGILKILGTEQIGTLLAAIAGYVLGRATQRARNEPTRTTAQEEQKKDKNELGAVQ